MSLNVLVVDDSMVMRAMITKTLRMCGVPIGDVVQASNGQEGLDALDQNWIDLALVDINMPVMTGEEMLEHMRRSSETQDLPVIVISTEGSQTRIDRLEQKGATFIHKPFTPEALRDTIKQITGIGTEQASRA